MELAQRGRALFPQALDDVPLRRVRDQGQRATVGQAQRLLSPRWQRRGQHRANDLPGRGHVVLRHEVGELENLRRQHRIEIDDRVDIAQLDALGGALRELEHHADVTSPADHHTHACARRHQGGQASGNPVGERVGQRQRHRDAGVGYRCDRSVAHPPPLVVSAVAFLQAAEQTLSAPALTPRSSAKKVPQTGHSASCLI